MTFGLCVYGLPQSEKQLEAARMPLTEGSPKFFFFEHDPLFLAVKFYFIEGIERWTGD